MCYFAIVDEEGSEVEYKDEDLVDLAEDDDDLIVDEDIYTQPDVRVGGEEDEDSIRSDEESDGD